MTNSRWWWTCVTQALQHQSPPPRIIQIKLILALVVSKVWSPGLSPWFRSVYFTHPRNFKPHNLNCEFFLNLTRSLFSVQWTWYTECICLLSKYQAQFGWTGINSVDGLEGLKLNALELCRPTWNNCIRLSAPQKLNVIPSDGCDWGWGGGD